jgi:hypothetical protein
MDTENQQLQRFAVELLEGESLSHFLGRFRRANSLTTTALGKITGLGAVVGRWEKLYLNPFPSRQELEALADVVMVDADRLAQMLPPKGVTMKPRPFCCVRFVMRRTPIIGLSGSLRSDGGAMVAPRTAFGIATSCVY